MVVIFSFLLWGWLGAWEGQNHILRNGGMREILAVLAQIGTLGFLVFVTTEFEGWEMPVQQLEFDEGSCDDDFLERGLTL